MATERLARAAGKGLGLEPDSALAHALLYASLGWRVLPIQEGTKKPLIRDWPSRASAKPTRVKSWWARWPDAGVAVLTGGGLVVLDVDVKRSEAGYESLRDLVSRHGHLPETPVVRTGGGGRHYYFAGDVRTSRGFRLGLDLQGQRACVVAPPSVHRSGARYMWEVPPDEVPLAPLPAWLAPEERLTDARPARPLGLLEPGGDIEEGCRHNTLLVLAGRLRHEGAGIEALLGELLAVNDARCVPPLFRLEVHEIAEWVSRQPSFWEQWKALVAAWSMPEPGRFRLSRWKVQQAFLDVSRLAESTRVAPGIRRLALLAQVAPKTAKRAIGSLLASGDLTVPRQARLPGRAQAYRLCLRAELKDARPSGAASAEASRVTQLDGKEGGDSALKEVREKRDIPVPISRHHRLPFTPTSRHHEKIFEQLARLNEEATVRWILERLAFRGRENALLILRVLDEKRPSSPADIRNRLRLPKSTVEKNLAWLQCQGFVGTLRRGQWVQGRLSISDLEGLALHRGKVQAWGRAQHRFKAERELYDVYFRERYQFDRLTGEILSGKGAPGPP